MIWGITFLSTDYQEKLQLRERLMYFENVLKNVWDGFTPKSGIVKKNNSESCFFQHEDLHVSTGHEEVTFH